MANLRREKDIITRNVNKFLQATNEDYVRYFEGSPTYVTYYQLDSVATRQDGNLENVNSLTGANSPNKYKKITDVVVYGVDALAISNEISEKGLQSLVSGEFVLLPDSITPYAGDFFTFDYDGLRDHLFRIDNVQYDKATPKKFFRASYAIYPENAEQVFENVIGDFVMDYKGIGTSGSAVITSADASNAENTKLMVDSLLTKFTEVFYDEDMDTFAFQTTSETGGTKLGIWSPYLQKFVHDTRLMDRYKREILTEIYVRDINETDNPAFFSDAAYRNSFFRKIETQDSNVVLSDTFFGLSNTDLKLTRNLPFFHVAQDYKMIDLNGDKNPILYYGPSHILFDTVHDTFDKVPADHKFVTSEDELDEDDLEVGDLVYQVANIETSTYPINVFRVAEGPTLYPVSIPDLISRTDLDGFIENPNTRLALQIIRSYLNNTLSVSSVSELYRYTTSWTKISYYTEIPANPKEGDYYLYNNVLKVYNAGNWVTVQYITELPAYGTRWFDEATNRLYTYTTAWDAGVVLPTSQPSTPGSVGARWFNEATDTLYTSVSASTWAGATTAQIAVSQPLPISGTLYLKQSLIAKLNGYFVENTVQAYVLLPIVIYILKQTIADSAK